MRIHILAGVLLALVRSTFAAETCKQAPVKQISGLAIYTPSTSSPVTAGQAYTITWQPTTGITTVSIQLLEGPDSTTLEPHGCVVDSIPNSGSYTWQVPEQLDAKPNGYGLKIIADGSGDFQYSMEFGVTGEKGPKHPKKITSTTLLPGSTIHTIVYHTKHHTRSHSSHHSHSHTSHSSLSHTSHSSHSYTSHSSHSRHESVSQSHKTESKKSHTSKSHTRSLFPTAAPSRHSHTYPSANATHHASHHRNHTAGLPTLVYSTGGHHHNKTLSPKPTKSITKPTSLEPITSVAITSLSGASQPEATVTAGDQQTTTSSSSAAAATTKAIAAGALAGLGAVAAMLL